MSRNHMIRVSEKEWQLLKARAEQNGFSTVAGYWRDKCLSDSIFVEQKLNRILKLLEDNV